MRCCCPLPTEAALFYVSLPIMRLGQTFTLSSDAVSPSTVLNSKTLIQTLRHIAQLYLATSDWEFFAKYSQILHPQLSYVSV
jgi:hypothetical protein